MRRLSGCQAAASCTDSNQVRSAGQLLCQALPPVARVQDFPRKETRLAPKLATDESCSDRIIVAFPGIQTGPRPPRRSASETTKSRSRGAATGRHIYRES